MRMVGRLRKLRKQTPDRCSDQKSKPSMIYFLQVSDDREHTNLRVKLGWSTDFTRRKYEHAGGSLGYQPVLKTLAVVYGTPSDEGVLKRYFRPISWRGQDEVFRPDPMIVDYVRWLRDQPYVWVPEIDGGELTGELARIASSLWLPSASNRDRTKPRPLSLFAHIDDPLGLPKPVMTGDDYYTSPKIIEAARTLFGGEIDLDPASHIAANRVVKARRFYSIDDDGLARPWAGNVWCNPPFSRWDEWAAKISGEWKRGQILQMCVMAACRTITAEHFRPVMESSCAMCVTDGRIPCWGDRASSPTDGHAIFYFGNDTSAFNRAFGSIGTIWMRSITTEPREC